MLAKMLVRITRNTPLAVPKLLKRAKARSQYFNSPTRAHFYKAPCALGFACWELTRKRVKLVSGFNESSFFFDLLCFLG